MIRFNNDYNRGAFDCILKALADTNTTSYPGYGEDEWCDKAEQIIKGLIGRDDSMIKFIPGATQANYVVVAAALSPVQSVIAADTGHINCHEAASIENTGHKILALPNTDGKISAAQIEACAAEYYDNAKPEYLTEPKMVYISFPTGRVLFTRKESFAISALSARNTACTCLLMVREWVMDWAQIKMTLHFVILPCFRMFFISVAQSVVRSLAKRWL